MTNVVVTHAPSGLVAATVARTAQVGPHLVRVTLTGPDLLRWRRGGYDQWLRLALPHGDPGALRRLPERYDLRGYLAHLRLPRGSRPVVRSYTVRELRDEPREMDLDFVVHGEQGVAGPWARAARPGDPVALIDQGCGWRPPPGSDGYLLVADETGLPAVAGILRDLPRDAVGVALVEVPDADDVQPVAAPPGVAVRWLVRVPGTRPGAPTLAEVEALTRDDLTAHPYAFAVGESTLATGARRHLVRRLGLAKDAVTFCGYWKAGR